MFDMDAGTPFEGVGLINAGCHYTVARIILMRSYLSNHCPQSPQKRLDRINPPEADKLDRPDFSCGIKVKP
jgi:hypothetical protein